MVKLHKGDEGELIFQMGMMPDNKTFVINFGKDVSWIGMTKQEAFEFAKEIMRHVVDRVVTIDIPDGEIKGGRS